MKLVTKSNTELMLSAIADELSNPDIAPEALAVAASNLASVAELATELLDVAKRRQLDILKARGERATDKGTLRCELDGWILEARPRNTGYDPRKIEGLLRAKGIVDPASYMDATIRLAVNENKLQQAIGAGVLTASEAAACKCEETYVVQRPRIMVRRFEEQDTDE